MEQYLIYIIPMVACLIFSAYFSATETAFSTMNRTRMKTLAEKNKRAALAIKLSEKYDKLISAILIGNNIVNIALASLGTVLFVTGFAMGDKGATVSTAVITVAVLIFGEITPKSIAKDFPEKFAMFSAPLMNLIMYILLPLTYVFSLWKKLISKLFKSNDDSKMSQEELLMLVEEVQQDGSIDGSEGDLLRNAIEFTELRAEDILTHRVNLIGFPKDATKEEIAQLFAESRFSRLLAYEENIDNIVGVLHQKDFFTDKGITDKPLSQLITPPLFIHQTEKINDLLKLLQSKKSHIAIVIDEYGGTLGIVTMEDILEELVGDIWDDTDVIITECVATGDNTYEVIGDMNIDDCFDEIDFVKPETFTCEYSTIGGWAIEMLDADPHVGDSFRYENLFVIVANMEEERVTKLTILVEQKNDEEEPID